MLLGVLRPWQPQVSPLVRLAMLVGACSVLVICGRYNAYAGGASLAAYPAVALASSAILLAVFGVKLGAGWLTSVWIYLGKISYGLYAFSFPALWLVHAYHLDAVIPAIVVGFFIDLTLAVISYHLWETPFLRWKRKFARASSGDRAEATSASTPN